MRISDWSSDVCSSDLEPDSLPRPARPVGHARSPVSARARLMEEVDWRELDFNQPFNRGSAMRELGISIDGVVLETEDKANWLEGWKWKDKRAGTPAVIWQLALDRKSTRLNSNH